jgi:Apg6 BARA domain
MGEEGEYASTTFRVPPLADEEEQEHVQPINTIDAATGVVVDTDDKRQRQAQDDGGGDAAAVDDDDMCSTTSLLSLQENRNIALRRQLAMIRAQRQRLTRWRAAEQHQQPAVQSLSSSSSSSSQVTLQERQSTINELQHEQDCALQDFLSMVARRRRLERLWHNDHANDGYGGGGGLNDCFHICHQGPFATINGLRLGCEAILSSGGPVENNSAALSRTGATAAMASTASMGSGGDHTNHSNGGTVPTNTALMIPAAAAAVVTRVPWSEINAALGLLALLLSSLEKKAHCGIRYRHEIHCAGSTSKMGYRAATTTSSSSAAAATMYNLYYSDDSGAFNSFNFFARRNFNTALHCLVQCVVDAADVIQQRDPTIALPHVIDNKHHTLAPSRWEFTVGGLPVAFGGGSSADTSGSIEWTRAMKYLLTNVKTLLVFRPFGLWDPAAESSIT